MSHHTWSADHGRQVQDRQNDLEAVRQSKERTVALLHGYDRVVDVGCGTGAGVLALGRGALGIDTSADMMRIAADRGVVGCRASALALPLRTGTVDGVRFDRVLYHLTRPEVALAEAARVVRRGGRVVCAHPDHESMVIEVPGASARMIDLAKRTRLELNYVNGTVPRRLPRMLLDLGFGDVTTEAFTLVLDDPDEPSVSLPTWVRSWRDRGQVDVTDDELSAWDTAVAQTRESGGYLFTLTYLVTYGTKS